MTASDGQLLERERDLGRLADAVSAAVGGSGVLAVVEGPAGIGKTSLLALSAQSAAAAGCQVLSARCDELERTLGFSVARQLFERRLTLESPTGREQLLSGSAERAGAALGLGSAEPEPLDEAVSIHGLYWLVANLAQQQPLVLIVDDAQWCDQSSLHWLRFLVRRLEGLAVTVLLGIREGENNAESTGLAELAADAAAMHVRPEPLSIGAASVLLATLGGGAVDPAFGLACHEWTGGNPLLLSELAAELSAAGVQPRSDAVEAMRGLVPGQLAQLTMLRIARLPVPALDLIRALAILGDTASLREAATLAGLGDADAERTADLLAEAQLLERELPPRFKHPLIRNVFYAEIPAARRAAEHKRAARILSADGRERELVAAHLLSSRPTGDPWVVEQLRTAAARELQRGSADAAVPLLTRAREEPPVPEARWAVLIELGRAQFQAHDFEAVESLQQAIDATDDPSEHADAALLLGRMWLYAGQSQAAVATLSAALADLDQHDDRYRELEATLIAAARLDHNLLAVAEDHSRRGYALIGGDSRGARLLSAQLSYQSVIGGGSVSEALSLARAALVDGRLIGESPGQPDAYVVAISMLAMCDQLDSADALYADALALAQRRGRALDFAIISALRCWTSHALGRLTEAELQARDGLRVAAESPELLGAIAGFATSVLVGSLLDQGSAQEAQAVLGSDPEGAESSISSARDLLFAQARLCAQRGEDGRAVRLLEACGDQHMRARIINPALLPWRSELALALARLGNLERARELAEEELALARRFGAARPIGVALRALGTVEAGPRGLELLSESASVLAGSSARLDQARSALALGSGLRRAGQRARARSVLREALHGATRCGAADLAASATQELEVLGSRPRTPLLYGVDALTPSERRVAGMAAEGMSNPQIAQALFVTRATIESHLHATYRKLGVASRDRLRHALGGTADQ